MTAQYFAASRADRTPVQHTHPFSNMISDFRWVVFAEKTNTKGLYMVGWLLCMSVNSITTLNLTPLIANHSFLFDHVSERGCGGLYTMLAKGHFVNNVMW